MTNQSENRDQETTSIKVCFNAIETDIPEYMLTYKRQCTTHNIIISTYNPLQHAS